LAVGDLRERLAHDRAYEFGDVRSRLLKVGGLEHGADLVDRLGDLLEIAVDQQSGEAAADDVLGLRVEAAHDPKVQEHDVALGVEHQVAGVHVAMEEAVFKSALQPRANTLLERAREVPTLRTELGEVVDLVTVDALHREHTRRRIAPTDRWDAHV